MITYKELIEFNLFKKKKQKIRSISKDEYFTDYLKWEKRVVVDSGANELWSDDYDPKSHHTLGLWDQTCHGIWDTNSNKGVVFKKTIELDNSDINRYKKKIK